MTTTTPSPQPTPMPPHSRSRTFHHGLSLTIAAVVVGLDQLTKALVVGFMAPGEMRQGIPGFLRLHHVQNTGAAFSLFEGNVFWLGVMSLLVSLGLVLWLVTSPPRRRLAATAYGLLLAGAVGNGLDRWCRDAVVDWIAFVPIQFPVFNLADVAINAAVALLLLDILLTSRHR